MAKYTLILPDELYIKVVKIASEEGISVGKLLNKIIKAWVDAYEKEKAK